jgi:hypothetical protein
LHGEKENFEEYSLFLEYAELSFAILINYLAEKNRPCPPATVCNIHFINVSLCAYVSVGHSAAGTEKYHNTGERKKLEV